MKQLKQSGKKDNKDLKSYAKDTHSEDNLTDETLSHNSLSHFDSDYLSLMPNLQSKTAFFNSLPGLSGDEYISYYRFYDVECLNTEDSDKK